MSRILVMMFKHPRRANTAMPMLQTGGETEMCNGSRLRVNCFELRVATLLT